MHRSADSARPAVVVHGGAWGIPDPEIKAHLAGVRAAAEAAWEVLDNGGSAMDAVERAIVLLEDDDTFDAATGSHLNRDGEVELDAGVMEGANLMAGAVAAVKRLKNPILAARKIMEVGDHILLVGEGAERYAAEKGVPLHPNHVLVVPRELTRWEQMRRGQFKLSTQDAFRQRHFGTVGAVALDREGQLVGGTSTGGSLFKRPGRVGDSPLPGCGYWADNDTAAVSTTGWGVSIIRVGLARLAADLVGQGAVGPEAAERAIQQLGDRVGGWGGLILIDRAGWVGFAHNTPRMAFAWRTPDMLAVDARIEAPTA
jgi:beta-aspartyl-peptidase (threonine type)